MIVNINFLWLYYIIKKNGYIILYFNFYILNYILSG